ncbi:MAG: ABC transporter ATP-binding protein [Clostridiales bacterium]|nr:ABC transporter ATP-binding protein [Clostridiales bacterium]
MKQLVRRTDKVKSIEYSNAIEINGLVKNYDDFKLGGIDLFLPKGYIMGLVGENGAGKTTMIKAILGLINKNGGAIRVMDQEMDGDGRDNIKEYVGVVLDDSGFPEDINLKDIDVIMSSCYKTWDHSKFGGFVRRFDLPEKKKIKAYSKGMKMKLSIAVALSHESRLLILDEATSGLDPVVRDEILDILREFIQDEEKSVFISSHILSDLEKICDYITFVHKGKLVFSESKDILLEKYGIVKCSWEALEALPAEAVVARRKNQFGGEALVEKELIGADIVTEHTSIEDIMLYYIKEERA